MGEDEVRKLYETVNEMRGVAPPVNDTLQQLQKLQQYLNHIESGIIHMNQIIQVLGFEADYCRRSIQMIHRILVDKEIITADEVEERHTKEVAEPIEKAKEDVKAQMMAAVEQRKAQESGIIGVEENTNVREED